MELIEQVQNEDVTGLPSTLFRVFHTAVFVSNPSIDDSY